MATILSIPPELRLRIYDLVLEKHDAVDAAIYRTEKNTRCIRYSREGPPSRTTTFVKGQFQWRY